MSKKSKAANRSKKNQSNAEIPEKSAAIRTFNVFIDGEYFQVGVDEVGGPPAIAYVQPNMTAPVAASPMPSFAGSVPPPPAPAAPAAPRPVSAAVPRAATKPVAAKVSAASATVSSVSTSGVAVEAPMPGMIIKYEKNVGDAVNKGETVVILEAMKMENALVAAASGVIKDVGYASGDSVSKGAVLALIEE